jgi:hypothetical protein
LVDKLLGEREVGPTFVEEGLPADSELIPPSITVGAPGDRQGVDGASPSR